jgi:hypothetical protein
VALVLSLATAALAIATLLAACGNADPFVGLYWEPSSGRRIEIRREGDGYSLIYGAAKLTSAARREGDELVIRHPLGGDTIVRKGDAEGVLIMESGGGTTRLKRLQQRQ